MTPHLKLNKVEKTQCTDYILKLFLCQISYIDFIHNSLYYRLWRRYVLLTNLRSCFRAWALLHSNHSHGLVANSRPHSRIACRNRLHLHHLETWHLARCHRSGGHLRSAPVLRILVISPLAF